MIQIIPKEIKFYPMFAEAAENVTDGARLMTAILRDMQDVVARVERLKELEHKGDELTHAIFTKLNQTFITPFDREDIHRLAASLDDVLDFVYAAGERLVMYHIRDTTDFAVELAEVITRQCQEISRAVTLLEKHDSALPHCVEINRLENEADQISRHAIAELFEHEKDPIQLIKLKELYEVLERATDKAEDVANVIETVVLKSA